MTIEKIIKGCKAFDREHQRALYLLTAEDLMRVAQRYMKNKEEAKDVFQESYITIFKKIHQFDSNKGSIGAWTGRIVVNIALDKLRSKKVFTDIEHLPVALHPLENESAIDNLSSDELLSVIKKLPDSYRTVFLLYVVEGYSHQEIADKMGITSSTSRSQLVRAKAKLRTLLLKKSRLNIKSYGAVK